MISRMSEYSGEIDRLTNELASGDEERMRVAKMKLQEIAEVMQRDVDAIDTVIRIYCRQKHADYEEATRE